MCCEFRKYRFRWYHGRVHEEVTFEQKVGALLRMRNRNREDHSFGSNTGKAIETKIV